MKKKNTLKLLSLLLIFAMMIQSLSGISAYLTDSDDATNTFVVGNVLIDLTEPNWPGDTSTSPNQITPKDPQVTNIGVNDAFVFVEVEVPYQDDLVVVDNDGTLNAAARTELFNYTVNDGWVEISTSTDIINGTVKHVYAYIGDNNGDLKALLSGETTPTLFDTIRFVNAIDGQWLEESELDVVVSAYAIQTNDINGGKTDPVGVWEVVFNTGVAGPAVEVPEVSEHGFFMSTPYINRSSSGEMEAIVFQSDDTYTTFSLHNGSSLYSNRDGNESESRNDSALYSDGSVYKYEYNPETRTVIDEFDREFVFSEDYASLQSNGENWYASGIESGVYYDDTYVNQDGDTIKFANGGYAQHMTSDGTLEFWSADWFGYDHCAYSEKYDYFVSLDGKTLYVYDYETDSTDTYVLVKSDAGSEDGGESEDEPDGDDATGSVYAIIANVAIDGSDESEVLLFISSADTINAGDVYNSSTFGNVIVSEVYSDFENISPLSRDDVLWSDHSETVAMVATECQVSPVSTAYWFDDFVNCEYLDMSLLDTSNTVDMNSMFQSTGFNTYSTELIGLNTWNTSNVENMSSMFEGFSGTYANIVGLSNWDVSSVTNMNRMFAAKSRGYANHFMNIDSLNRWDTSNVTDMSYMFELCIDLTNLDIGHWDTSSVTDMGYMFSGCSSLTSLDFDNWDTSNVENMEYMFSECSSLTSLDLSGFNTGKVINMEYMFASCYELSTLKLDNFDTTNVVDMTRMFSYGRKLEMVTIGAAFEFKGNAPFPDTSRYVFGADGMWYNTETKEGYLPSEIPSNTKATYVARPLGVYDSYMLGTGTQFNHILSDDITSIVFTDDVAPNGAVLKDVSANGDKSVVAWMDGTVLYVSTQVEGIQVIANPDSSSMFEFTITTPDRRQLTSIDVSNLDTSRVTNMSAMFYGCTKLTQLDLSGFDTSDVTTMRSMFYSCKSLSKLDLRGFDTKNVTDMDGMFSQCNNLTQLNLNGFNTKNVTDMDNLFNGCNSLTELDLSGFDTSNVTRMNQMFYQCKSLKELDLSSFNTNNVTDMGVMFYNCSSLTKIYVSDAWNTYNVKTSNNMFYNCTKLVGGAGTKYDSNYVTAARARIDSTSTPGYFASQTTPIQFNSDVVAVGETRPLLFTLPNTSWSIVDTEVLSGAGFLTLNENELTVTGTSKGTASVRIHIQRDDGSVVTKEATLYIVDGAYAVYSDTDKSLIFYNTKDATSAGFDNHGQAITKVFNTGFDSKLYPYASQIPWYSYRNDIKTVIVKDTIRPTNTTYWFYEFTSCTSMDLKKMDTLYATEMNQMFFNCYDLVDLDISHFNTRWVTNMNAMFYGCKSITSLDLSSFNTNKVTIMNAMFFMNESLETIYVSDAWDVTNVTSHGSMFLGCYNLVGQSGAAYNSSNCDKNAANYETGYLTYK